MNCQPIPRSWFQAIAGFLILVLVNHFVADWITRHTKSNKAYWLIEADPEQTDCVVLGSSAALASIDPTLLAKELDSDVLMLAEEGAAFPEQALIWKLFLERRQSKMLLLEVDAWGLTDMGYSWPFHEYHYLPYLNHPQVEQAVSEQKGPLLTVAWKYVPMLKFAQYNSQFGINQLGSLLKGTRYNPRQPGTNSKVATAARLAAACKDELMVGWQWDQGRINALHEILDLSEKQGVQTILYYSPIYRDCRFAEAAKILEFYRELAATRKIPLLIIDDQKILGEASYFKDATHMNAQGAERFTQEIAARIKAAKLAKPD